MKKLLVISNHPPEKWEDEQKKGWDKIEFIPFPEVDPNATRESVSEMARLFFLQLKSRLDTDPNLFVCLQGEFTFFFEFCYYLSEYPSLRKRFVFPTTKRVVEEQKNSDGTVSKVYKFKFVRWR
ncbi:MAG: hypothetical protein ABIM98_07415 [candidate division WOR-3 bacterium]